MFASSEAIRHRENPKRNMTIIPYSLLANGNLIEGLFPIGSLIQTQWGPRCVIAHEMHKIVIKQEPDFC